MKNFINHDFNITNIEFICHLETRIAKDQHVNTKHHTISFMPKGKVKYTLPDGTSRISYDNYVSFEPKGSTTSDKALVDAAIAAARKARFTESKAFVQGGRITYVFRMK